MEKQAQEADPCIGCHLCETGLISTCTKKEIYDMRQEAPKAASQSAEDIDKYADALTYILSALAKNILMGIKGEKEYIRAVGEFEENAIEHIKRYFNEIASAQRQAGREDAWKECPSCHCAIDDAGRGHHSAADCKYLKRELEEEARYAALEIAARELLTYCNTCDGEWESKEGEYMSCDEVANLPDEDLCPYCKLDKALSALDEARKG